MVTNIGAVLKQERLRQELSLEDIQKTTRIREKNLVAVEECNWSVFSSRTYIQGIIRTYSAYLHLDEEKMLAYFRREYERHEQLKFKKRTSSTQFAPFTKRVVRLIILLLILVFSLFFGYQLYLFMAPPKLILLEPAKTQFKREQKITLKGRVEKNTTIHINRQQIFSS